MPERDQIKKHMKVLGSDGRHVGTVDCVERDTIVLTKSDPASNGEHHDIPMSWLAEVDENGVHLNQPADTARRLWQPSAKAACKE